MLKERIKADVISAMKERNGEVASVLRLVLASIDTKQKEKHYKIAKEKPDMPEDQLAKESQLTEEEMISVVSSEIKKRKDAIALYEQGGRLELAESEKKEIEMIKVYLPEQLSPEVLRQLIEASIAKVGATEIKDTGKIMADLMPQVKGKADNAEISKIIKELLSK